jgi:hypothetical protein
MRPHRVTMIEAPLRTRLMMRIRQPLAPTLAPFAAVDLPTIVGLADVEDLGAASATNPHKNLDIVHASALTAALMNLPARAPSGTFAQSASTRDTKAQGSTPGPSLFAAESIAYATPSPVATFRPTHDPATPRCTDFTGSRRPFTAAT